RSEAKRFAARGPDDCRRVPFAETRRAICGRMRRPRLCAESPDATGSSLEPARDRWRRSPWYFPTPGDYATRLERAGFRVDSIALIPRPTPLPGDVVDWLETFAQTFLHGLPGVARAEYLQE